MSLTPESWLSAQSLLALPGVHGMGHYPVARRHEMNAAPPDFIPARLRSGRLARSSRCARRRKAAKPCSMWRRGRWPGGSDTIAVFRREGFRDRRILLAIFACRECCHGLLSSSSWPAAHDFTPVRAGGKLLAVLAFVIPALIKLRLLKGLSTARRSCAVGICGSSATAGEPGTWRCIASQARAHVARAACSRQLATHAPPDRRRRERVSKRNPARLP